ncbi:erythrocyte membrane protein 1 (PfEMP1), exon 2, putative [Plasmodium reichenowi]|uniref:Erythrocyte membrane protein 1 (PfEMP1), exon 2, putative n=1 Tax=Plasmodium reichenowi TaxID=5854 RepID=A0A2P9D1X8_PLARE|nr:erythrocyte membrane protein 1 (PfEMP1), exon 2, putative [Plasmodium reichenowi]
MCEKWKKNNKVEILDKLKEEWNKDNNKHNGENNINKMLNIDVSIQIDMDNPKSINEFTNMDTYTDKYIMDTIMIYNYDVDHNKQSPDNNNNNNTDVLSKVQIEMDVVNNKKEIFEDEYIISDM